MNLWEDLRDAAAQQETTDALTALHKIAVSLRCVAESYQARSITELGDILAARADEAMAARRSAWECAAPRTPALP